ncbi:MAG: hypothetical protein ACK4UN_20975, partial [Limisphaerales bacterium]
MSSQTTALPSEAVEAIEQWYEQGKFLQAYEFSKQFGPLETWQGTKALLIAGRLAGHLGSRSLTEKLHLRAYLRDRSHPEAQYYYAWAILHSRGPLAAWKWLKRNINMDAVDGKLCADIMTLQARAASLLRDFSKAEELLANAEALVPGHKWSQVERLFLLEAEDRYEEALEAAKQVCAQHHWYRPAVHAHAHMLQLLNRDEEALDLLQNGSEHIEGTSLLCELTGLQIELKRFAEAKLNLQRCRQNAPLMDKLFEQWLNANSADVEYHCGNFAAAAEFAGKVDGPFYQKFAVELQKPGAGKNRVELPVGFVRQHHMTCAPATLTALSKFWGKQVEHVALAETICYDGTPAYSERSWAEKNGWVAREFKVTQ